MTNALRTAPPRARRKTPSRGSAALIAGAAAGIAAAWYNHRRARQAERDTPPAGSFVEVDGVALHYVERGAGSPLVLLHGNGATVQDMEASGLLDRLAATHRVIAFDRPGFGYTGRPRSRIWTAQAQAELIGHALAKLGVGPAVVVGHSWGTLVALALALNMPAAVSRIVLLSGYYFPNVRLDVPLLSGPAIPVVGDVMSHTISPLLGRLMTPTLVKRIFQPAPVADSFAGFPIELALRPSQVRASAADTALMIPAAASLSARYGELTMPVAIVAGDGDKIIDCEQAERLHAALPGSTLRLIPGAGHMVHHSATEAVVEAITAA